MEQNPSFTNTGRHILTATNTQQLLSQMQVQQCDVFTDENMQMIKLTITISISLVEKSLEPSSVRRSISSLNHRM